MKKPVALAAIVALSCALLGCAEGPVPRTTGDAASASSFTQQVETPADAPTLTGIADLGNARFRIDPSWPEFTAVDLVQWDLSDTVTLTAAVCEPSNQLPDEFADWCDASWTADGCAWVYSEQTSSAGKTWVLGVASTDGETAGVVFMATEKGAPEDAAMPPDVWAVFDSVAIE
ncbi:hypothetical protein QJ043_07595 [Olsenella sp. YH-ols2217]|uniref:Uncharacterized protein n=1 Tax=Kribbibacterium absianum TaxID=3044210 RepID=A0ABT6ZMB5_9ACTN|nr:MULTISPECIES: hypothetical protein [unclassified Olsenella]MDJ1121931.1 hypothetical protein [Olsenella sp. YH-ols2216]MDJ1129939.1 hypothetical protein [Olsenella sp. YH-ols2217]